MQQGTPVLDPRAVLDLDHPLIAMKTASYDVQFMGEGEIIEITQPDPKPDAFDRLDEASTHLALFAHAAEQGLQSMGLTGDQRLEVSQILVFVQDLGRRFDKVRVPGYERAAKKHV